MSSVIPPGGLAPKSQTVGLGGALRAISQDRPSVASFSRIRRDPPEDGDSSSVPDPAESALSRLRKHIPKLRHRAKLLFMGSWISGLIALLGGGMWLLDLPDAPPPWHHIQYPAGLHLALHIGAGAVTFLHQSFLQQISGFCTGPLGIGISVSFALVGMVLGAGRNDPLPVVIGVATAALLQFGPSVLLQTVDPGANRTSTSVSIQHLSVPEIQKLRSEQTNPKVILSLTWVLAQKAYFGTRTAQFPQEVARLDEAHFSSHLSRVANLPVSATTARLLVLSQAARLPAEVSALQREMFLERQRDEALQQGGLDFAGAGAAGVLLFGIPALTLRRRAVRLAYKLER